MLLASVFDYKTLWTFVKSTGVLDDICMTALLLLFLCTIVKICYEVYFKRASFSLQNFKAAFFYVSMCAVLFGSPTTYTIIADLIVDCFGVFNSFTANYIDKANDQLHYLLYVAKQHEIDTIQYFNPKLWLTNPALIVIATSINVSIIVMIASLSIAPVYMICSILVGPLMFAFGAVLGNGIIRKWLLLLVASILIQLSIGIVYMIIGDSMLFTLVGDTFDAGMLQIAGTVAMLCIILCLAVPILHGYLFDTKVFYILPIVFGIVTFFFGGFVILIKIAALMKAGNRLKKLQAGI